MSTMTTEIAPSRELDYRESDGLQVWLLWLPAEDAVVVRVLDARRGLLLELPTDGAHALDVFHHPFAYAPPVELEPEPADVEADEPATAAG
jgi:hypothetical protein